MSLCYWWWILSFWEGTFLLNCFYTWASCPGRCSGGWEPSTWLRAQACLSKCRCLPWDKKTGAVNCIGYMRICSVDCEGFLGWLPDGANACVVLSSTSCWNEVAFILSEALSRISKDDRIWLLVLFFLVRRTLCSKCAYMQLKKWGPSAFTGTTAVRLLLWSCSGDERCSQITTYPRAPSAHLCSYIATAVLSIPDSILFLFEGLTGVFDFHLAWPQWCVLRCSVMCVLWLWC